MFDPVSNEMGGMKWMVYGRLNYVSI